MGRYGTLINDVRELEGTLADHNLALDKARSSSDVSEQRRYCDMLKVRAGCTCVFTRNALLTALRHPFVGTPRAARPATMRSGTRWTACSWSGSGERRP